MSGNTIYSVVIPTYNSEQFIVKTLESVLDQTFNNFEIVLSDDGSQDNTIALSEKLFKERDFSNYKILKNNHQGPGASRNSGVMAARSEWIAFLDSDDLWTSEKLQEVEALREGEEYSLIFHDELYLYEDNSSAPLIHHDKFIESLHPFISLYRENFLSPSATVLKKSLFLEVNGFDTSLPSAQDYDLWLRLALSPNLRIGCIKKELGYYAVRDGSITSNVEKRKRCMLVIYEKNKQSVKQLSPYPVLELLRFKGRIFSVLGLRLLRQGRPLKGFVYIGWGLVQWPRFDWMKKAFLKVLGR